MVYIFGAKMCRILRKQSFNLTAIWGRGQGNEILHQAETNANIVFNHYCRSITDSRIVTVIIAFSYSSVGIGIFSEFSLCPFFYRNCSQHHTLHASLLYTFWSSLFINVTMLPGSTDSFTFSISSIATLASSTTFTDTLNKLVL